MADTGYSRPSPDSHHGDLVSDHGELANDDGYKSMRTEFR